MNTTQKQSKTKPAREVITPAEEVFMYYKNGMAGSGWTALIDAIFKLDRIQRAKLAKGFPELVTVCNRYNDEMGYWNDLQKRWIKHNQLSNATI
jgi:hypothetical protein